MSSDSLVLRAHIRRRMACRLPIARTYWVQNVQHPRHPLTGIPRLAISRHRTGTFACFYLVHLLSVIDDNTVHPSALLPLRPVLVPTIALLPALVVY
jgi:hypothetical protein